MLAAMDGVLDEHRPDWVLVYGDTNSTIAGALSAVKMHLPLAHLEAGLRSFNRRMPEEHNRVLTDHAADLCLAPTQTAIDHLTREGLAERAVMVGDVMTDVCLRVAAQVRDSAPPLPEGVDGSAEIPGVDHPPGREHRRPRAAQGHHRCPGGTARPCLAAGTSTTRGPRGRGPDRPQAGRVADH